MTKSKKKSHEPMHLQRIQAYRCQCGNPACMVTLVAMGSLEKVEALIALEPEQAVAIAAEILHAIPSAGHA